MPKIRHLDGHVQVNQHWTVIRPGERANVARHAGGLIHLTVKRLGHSRWQWRVAGAGRTRSGESKTASEGQDAAEQAAQAVVQEAAA
ncbi:MAG: hypothetical protein F4Z31_01565 [Gemmatimonadetes bacterium]|nr:hypothetical protein [Gemmatimonadota bacterium]